MSRPAFSVKAFGFYLLALGAALMAAPNLRFSVFGMPQMTQVWIRVAGVVAFNAGVYSIFAAQCAARAFFQATVYTGACVLRGEPKPA